MCLPGRRSNELPAAASFTLIAVPKGLIGGIFGSLFTELTETYKVFELSDSPPLFCGRREPVSGGWGDHRILIARAVAVVVAVAAAVVVAAHARGAGARG